MNLTDDDLIKQLKHLSYETGFSTLSIINQPQLETASWQLKNWCSKNYHGDMKYLKNHIDLRTNPHQLFPGLKSIISLSLNYWQSNNLGEEWKILNNKEMAYISRYALGGDYHKYFRKKMLNFARSLEQILGKFSYRVVTDSAPVFEVEIAEQSGLGWRGKNTLLLTRHGSLFFIGEILTSLELPNTQIQQQHCGKCTKCLDICPTNAFIAPYQIDARRCISYLTIEYHGSIPIELRKKIGNRIYGCDDCQLICPWNKFATQGDNYFAFKNQLNQSTLLELLSWSSEDFAEKLATSPIKRIGHERWLRNIAVAIGNAATFYQTNNLTQEVIKHLSIWQNHPSQIVREHINWAIAENINTLN